MTKSFFSTADIFLHNQTAWDRMARERGDWSQPVSAEIIQAARAGDWQVQLTPAEMPSGWLPDVEGKRILCLAASGGQQAPVLAAAGADVVVLDASREQLNLDEWVAQRDELKLQTLLGDMRDLSAFADDSFDVIFHPISNLYVPDLHRVWSECFRVLRHGGRLLSSFYNPVVFVFERNEALAAEGLLKPRFVLPYADITDLDADELAKKQEANQALVFGHSLADQINGQLQAGFLVAGFDEVFHPHPRFLIERYMPTFMATYAIKPM